MIVSALADGHLTVRVMRKEQGMTEKKMVKSARRELGFVDQSVNEKSVVAYMRRAKKLSSAKLYKISCDGLRFYIKGSLWDVHHFYLANIKTMHNVPTVPSYNGLPALGLAPANEAKYFVTNIELVNVDGERVYAREAKCTAQAIYILECYWGNEPVDMGEYRRLGNESKGNEPSPLDLADKEDIDYESYIEPRPNPFYFEPSNHVEILPLGLAPFEPSNHVEVLDLVTSPEPSNLVEISGLNHPACPLFESPNLVEISGLVGSLGLLDWSVLTRIPPTESKVDRLIELAEEQNSMMRDLLALLRVGGINEGKKALPYIPNVSVGSIELPPINKGKIKDRELDLSTPERESFMKRTLERYEYWRVGQEISKAKAYKAVFAEMTTVGIDYNVWYNDFVFANRGKGNDQKPDDLYVVEEHNVISWFEKFFRIHEGRVIKQTKGDK
jgi:hypothetical protein